ncbi:adenylate kinase 8-like [Crotalus tigris]|uniref:adenylate kinase 8-like n=1 Tax=Crotalus tigris TaxID=88082 RepID=UPI00192F4DF3|nr:adenylate kinase 8-like [Crotalus tigris]XP_039189323.1 adenylate kinase 8-like [Crotalus tigris]
MDATSKPHQIPPEMGIYAEKHNIFQIMQGLMEALLVARPAKPIDFMIEHLKKNNEEVPRVFIVGPPASGKTTIARWICKHLSATYLCPKELVRIKLLKKAKEAEGYQTRGEKIPDELWASLLQERLSDVDCETLGWVVDGFPQTRNQALELQTLGVLPRHLVVLYAPDTVLIERNLGKRVDPLTQEVYHTTFDWPVDFTVQKRLVKPEDTSEQATARRLLENHRNMPGIVQTYQDCYKAINADQPCVDVFAQALNFVQSRPRSNAPFTPRILLLGPPGSGKSLQAALLSQKYGVVNIFFGDLLREKVAGNTGVGEFIKPFFKMRCPVKDNIALHVLKERLEQDDCRTYGWVLHGFPRDVDQALLFRQIDVEPNRVFFLNLPTEVGLQRICQRATDPISGERYHTIYKPPVDEEVHQRLCRHPKDDPLQVERKTDIYSHRLAELEEHYEDSICLNADQDPYTVFEYIESCLVKPLPICKL